MRVSPSPATPMRSLASIAAVGVEGAGWAVGLVRKGLLVLIDLTSLCVAASVAFVTWAASVRGQSLELYRELWPLLGLFLLAYWRAGLYPGFGLGGVEILRRSTVATTSVFVLLAALDFVFKAPPRYSRMTFFLAWLLAILLIPLGRYLFYAVARRWRWWPAPCVVLGTGRVAAHTVASLREALTLGYRPVAVLAGRSEGSPETVGGVRVHGSAEQAEQLARRGVQVAIMVDGPGEPWDAMWLARLQSHFRHVLWIHRSGDLPAEGVQLKNLGGVVGVEYVNQLLLPRNRVAKRLLDLTLGTALAVVSLPLLALGVLAVRLSSKGPAFYSQEREGRDGRPIRVWKLRTMYVDAEQRLQEVLADDAGRRWEWERRFKLEDDPRIVSVVGSFLRRFSLDELPQLWQVVPGTLSLVGPRPFPPYHLESYDPTILQLRRRVRPGVTGLWQVKVRGAGEIELQESHDAYYIRNWSLWMDLYVLARTAFAVLAGRGAM